MRVAPGPDGFRASVGDMGVRTFVHVSAMRTLRDGIGRLPANVEGACLPRRDGTRHDGRQDVPPDGVQPRPMLSVRL
ncbi:hypothetical protein GCM10023258_18150 [Terrabacter aeriphilus]|uniref:Uncharacterized protein n=1 Tax=Terrabacter aeriphilus TaxID=515662 RepID=A0ABP9JBL4_9MICO